VVDLGTLGSDVLQNVVYLATPPLLWLFVYLLAWQSPALARATGFGRLTFWLLLPGALLGTFADLPIVPISSAVLALNLGGGLIPLLLAFSLLHREADGRTATVGLFAALFAAESVAALLWVLAVPADLIAFTLPFPGAPLGVPVSVLGVLGLVAVAPVALAAASAGSPNDRSVTVGLALTSVALGATFLTTEAAPGIGIVSSFPEYLLAPVLVGVGGVVGLRWATGRPAYRGLGVAYAASTLGVLVGADVLRQPPLYHPAANAVYAIGGAGLLDLLYLTGLLALAAAFLTYLVLARLGRAGPAPPLLPPTPLTPGGRLRRSLAMLLSGQFVAATQEAAGAAQDAQRQARSLTGLPPVAFSDHPWAELGAPPWVDGDQRNLSGLTSRLDLGARDAWRAHLTARYLVRFARTVARRRFGSFARRSLAFVVDLAVVTPPAVAVWWYLSAGTAGSLDTVLGSAGFNAAAFGYAAFAFAYFVLGEFAFGSTVGKHLFRLRVRDRGLRPPPAIPVILRDLPKLIPLSIIGFGGAVATLLAVRGTAGSVVTSGLTLPADLLVVANLLVGIGLGVLVCGAISLLAIHLSGENQRLGDYLAGTWVIQE
jgi:uncharacterized membrane protein